MSELYLVRHGQASFGKSNYDNLSDLGRIQATHTAKFLVDKGIEPDVIYSGDLQRQLDTTTPYVEALKEAGSTKHRYVVDERFNEFHAEAIIKHTLPRLAAQNMEIAKLMTMGGGLSKNFQKIFIPVIKSWLQDEFPSDDIEPWKTFQNRVYQAIDDITRNQPKSSKIVVFTSGGVIATSLQKVLGTSDDIVFKLNYKIANASITKMLFNDDGIVLSFFNNYSHMEDNDREELLTFR